MKEFETNKNKSNLKQLQIDEISWKLMRY